MFKRRNLIAVYLCLLTAISLGAGELIFADRSEHPSYRENRMLSAFPALSAETVFDGSFMDGFESWLSDAFFFREQAAGFSDAVKALFQLPREGGEQPNEGLDQNQLFETDEEQQKELEQVLQQEIPESPHDDPAAAETRHDISYAPVGEVAADAESWLQREDGSRLVIGSISAESLDAVARILAEYRAELPEDGTVHLICPPVSATANRIIRGRDFVGWGNSLKDVLQPVVCEGVVIHDAMEIASPYLQTERLYPTVDHHWHPFFACQAVNAMLGEQGVSTCGYYEYRYTLADTAYTASFDEQELKGLSYNAEIVQVMVPVAPAESYIVRRLTERSDSVLIAHDLSGYRQYLGGTRAPWRLFIGGFHTGRRALVISDSFGNCLIPYLLPYYDEVLSTDFRDNGYAIYEAGANAHQYIQQYGIDDIYLVLCTATPLDGEVVQDRFERYLYLDYEELERGLGR